MKDIEVMLRGFAMLIDGPQYAPSLVRFLNQFSRRCETHTDEQNVLLGCIFNTFISACDNLPIGAFINARNKRFNIALFEATFAAVCQKAFNERRELTDKIDPAEVAALAIDSQFLKASLEGTTRTANVELRLARAKAIITAL